MRNIKRDVKKMTVEELRREKQLRKVLIRDITGLNRARLSKIEQELDRRDDLSKMA